MQWPNKKKFIITIWIIFLFSMLITLHNSSYLERVTDFVGTLDTFGDGRESMITEQDYLINETLYPCSMTPEDDWFNDPRRAIQIERTHNKIFFNRVPKCGSGLARFVMARLATLNDFLIHNDGGRPDSHWNNGTIGKQNVQGRVFDHFPQGGPPTMLVGHIHFVNFTQFSQKLSMPIYINLIRDPISRLVSWYHFIRFEHKRGYLTMEERFRTFDYCVEKGYPECTETRHIFTIIPYFCGSDPICQIPGIRSLERAKQNVVTYFSVVGYMERFDDFFYAIEVMLPRFFSNATSVYNEMKHVKLEKRTQKTKIYPSEDTVEKLKRKLPYEYEFYYFIRSRFDCLMKRLKS